MDNNSNMLQLCRLCLVKDDVNIPIFEEQGDIRQIFLKISSCLPVKVSRDDRLPKKICDGCSYKLDMLYEFWNTSANAEKQLLTWLGEAGMTSQMADGTISAVAQQIKPSDDFVKQEAIDPPDIQSDDDDKDYVFPEKEDEKSRNNVDEPPPKRARRTAAVKAAIAMDQDSDDDDSGEPMTKIEDDSEDSDNDDHEPAFVDVPSTSADDQPGPSGVGKDGVEAPNKVFWYSDDELYISPNQIKQEKIDINEENDINNPLPIKSRGRYEVAYQKFMIWRFKNNKHSFSEDVMIEYFQELSNKLKPSSLWGLYSMLRMTLNINDNVNIATYTELKALLKRKAYGIKNKNLKVLTADNINNFLQNAPDSKYLLMKVILIIGISGACRKQELRNITLEHIEDTGNTLVIDIPDAYTNTQRSFVVSETYYPKCKKYMNLRPTGEGTKFLPFFLNYQKQKCTKQSVGINKIGSIPKKIAEYLGLPETKRYTGHCFRRCSAYISVGGDPLLLKKSRE